MLEYEEARSKGRYASKPRIPKYDHPWSGRLKIIIQERFSFEDCKAYVLEDRIGEILIALFEASNILRLQRIAAAEKYQREVEARRIMEQKKQQYNAEIEKTKALLNKARDYKTAHMIREYIAAIRTACLRSLFLSITEVYMNKGTGSLNGCSPRCFLRLYGGPLVSEPVYSLRLHLFAHSNVR